MNNDDNHIHDDLNEDQQIEHDSFVSNQIFHKIFSELPPCCDPTLIAYGLWVQMIPMLVSSGWTLTNLRKDLLNNIEMMANMANKALAVDPADEFTDQLLTKSNNQ